MALLPSSTEAVSNHVVGVSPLSITPARKSGIAAPTMLLTGHEGEVLTVEFSPDGRNVASGSFDNTILIYNVYGNCDNWCILKGHSNAVLELHWSYDSKNLYTCCADATVAVWDVENGKRTKKFSEHSAVVNSLQCVRRGPPMLVSGSDDGCTKLWDLRTRKCVKTYESNYQILSVAFDDTATRIFAGSLDNTIRVYDVRTEKELEAFEGHTDSVTGVDVSKDGAYLLSNGMDHTIRLWNIEPFFEDSNRCTHILTGASHNFERNLLRVRWSSDDALCSAGSADRNVYVWCMKSKSLLYRLPGHTGSVNEVAFHPTEPVVASASSDKTIYMGELG